MPYSQEISRDRPGVFLFLIDQSRSMNKPFGADDKGKPVSRAAAVADALNNTLEELVNRCMRDEGVRDYFNIGVIGYGRTNRPEFCWQKGLAGQSLVPISEVAQHAQIEERQIQTLVRDHYVEETVTVSRWIEPVAVESTPMNGAFKMAYATLAEWIYRNPSSFPPIVINITDGMANDVDTPQELLTTVQQLTKLKTSDGNVFLMNCHISDQTEEPVFFPWNATELPNDPYAQLLFEMSSEMTDRGRAIICELYDRDLESTPNMRAMAFNADAVALIKLLDIGTRQAIAPPPLREETQVEEPA